MTELIKCRLCGGKGKQYTHEDRKWDGNPGWISVCYCMRCGIQVSAFSEQPLKAEERRRDIGTGLFMTRKSEKKR